MHRVWCVCSCVHVYKGVSQGTASMLGDANAWPTTQVDRIDDKSGSEESDKDASTSASDEEADDNQAPARKRSASNKARAAALDILQGGANEDGEGAKPKTGLFSLPFMTRAAERQRLNAQQEAAAVLAQLEAEDEQAAAGSDADVDGAEPQSWESGRGNAGRMAFGAGSASQPQVCLLC